MSGTEAITYAEVSQHSSKKDLYLVIHNKVYNVSSFVDEHPYVLPPEAPQPFSPIQSHSLAVKKACSTWAAKTQEDVGHSDEAREILDGLKVGTLKREEGDPAPKTGSTSYVAAGPKESSSSSSSTTSLGVGLYAIILLGGAFAFAAYKYLQVNDKQ
ncbi:hypothetical protein EPUS_07287 [Endocarpon pusillum Z07020]|uniref:Cytochrome b5 heme-binding domain-containing protein n=1 Tax=Endocarpon pusillum (strain Z07020 / HMAS-L-300199) TaxID=1263415 RepID=U1FX73_ENDPU|nr:uncharacterized protein EPUS_07287 [Endocarpon pusillum Z07020]ERF69472.1 hypothetical protein EPUS_07287 [Endocarpon pusillum Z07020]